MNMKQMFSMFSNVLLLKKKKKRFKMKTMKIFRISGSIYLKS